MEARQFFFALCIEHVTVGHFAEVLIALHLIVGENTFDRIDAGELVVFDEVPAEIGLAVRLDPSPAIGDAHLLSRFGQLRCKGFIQNVLILEEDILGE